MTQTSEIPLITSAELDAMQWVAQDRLRTVDAMAAELEYALEAAEVEIAAAVRDGSTDAVAAAAWADTRAKVESDLTRLLRQWPEVKS